MRFLRCHEIVYGMDIVLIDNEEGTVITAPEANAAYRVNGFDPFAEGGLTTDGSGDIATIRLRVTLLP